MSDPHSTQRRETCDRQCGVVVYLGVVGELGEYLLRRQAGPGGDGTQAAADIGGQPDLCKQFVLRFLALLDPCGVPVLSDPPPRLALLCPDCPLGVLLGVVLLLYGRLQQGLTHLDGR
ncbi:hypothetical protein GCM10010255_61970 [Streptomyces coeruleofuscus]|uniref:Uncharacterized protein n=1 Tax=Streptomyces coeruleofuscus TaxID=66879 RepID=A0ABN3IXR3_9ACTN